MNKFAFVDCKTVDEALGQLDGGATVKAGGIDLLDLMKDGIVTPPKLVNIRNVGSLRGITTGADGLHLGPLSTLSEIAAHPEIQKSYTALADAAGHAATPQATKPLSSQANLSLASLCPRRSLVHGPPIRSMERRRASIGHLRMPASYSLWTGRIAERRGSPSASQLPRLFVPPQPRLC